MFINKVIAEQPGALTGDQIERVLGTLHMAFERPAIVTHPADGKPTVTLALLQKLSLIAPNSNVVADISNIKSEITARTK